MKEIEQLIEKNRNIIHNETLPPIPDEFKDGKDRGKFADWIRTKTKMSTFPLDIDIPHEEINAEAMAQKHLFTKHRSGKSPGWSSMAIHGTAVNHTQPREYYFKDGPMPEYDWTDLAKDCPVTKEWLLSLGFKRFSRVRFMLLEPGGYIEPHSDIPDGNQEIYAWNVAITNPPGHTFVMDGHGLVPWKVGQMRGIDISRYHTVINNDVEPRLHMIIHGGGDDKFAETMCRSYEKLV